MTAGARIAAAIVALTAAAGLVIQFGATLATNGSVAATLGTLARFFTIWTNLLVALSFAMLASGRAVAPRSIGGITLAILLVGIVYGLLLRGLKTLAGGALVADHLLHLAVPMLVPLWWIAFAEKGRLERRDPWLWTLYPLAYFGYALVRGAFEGRYAYPFIDVGTLGLARVLLNALAISIGFVVAGHGLLWLDRRFSARPSRPPPRSTGSAQSP